MTTETTVYENCIDVKAPRVNLGALFGEEIEVVDVPWKEHWVGMPDFENEKNENHKKLVVNFRTQEDYDDFAILIGQKLTPKTRSIWFPVLIPGADSLWRYINEDMLQENDINES